MTPGQDNGGRRRRRPRQTPLAEVVPPPPEVRAPKPVKATEPRRFSRRRLGGIGAIGLSPAFRAYLFVGSLLAVVGFLLYNESVIRHLRDQEKRNVDLYAKLISLAPLASDDQSVAIFEEIVINPKITFPIIVTDHRGRAVIQKNVPLPGTASPGWLAPIRRLFGSGESAAPAAPDEAVTAAYLRQRVAEMDAQNPPIPFYQFREVSAYLRRAGERVVITDGEGEVVQWRGPGLPTQGDTTAAARQQVTAALQEMTESAGAGSSLAFNVPVDDLSYVHYDADRLIVTDGRGEVRQWQGRDLPAPGDTTAAARTGVATALREMIGRSEPLVVRIDAENYIHYGDTELVARVTRAAFIQVGALLLFVLVGYIGLRNIRRSEQRSIWVGMAKETAHQLGTPLSSLAGWLELIREAAAAPADPQRLERIGQMTDEMQRDLQRLAQIASRFSQIGSIPELRPGDVVAILRETAAYFEGRGPQFGRHQVAIEVPEPVPEIPLNADLLGWVFENLFKNAIDAIEHGAGVIEIGVTRSADGRWVIVTFRDNGRGIDPDDLGRIFEPGFSTKKRGWGLGLAFVRRIVEEYHGGRISVLRTAPGQGTTFEVILPVSAR